MLQKLFREFLEELLKMSGKIPLGALEEDRAIISEETLRRTAEKP